MNKNIIALARTLIILSGLVLLLGQVLYFPLMGQELAIQFPEVNYLAVPYTVLAILTLLCLEVALVGVWRLLSLAAIDKVFSVRAFTWVNAVIVAVAAATIITLGVAIHLLGILSVGGPGVLIILTTAVVGGAMFTVLMLVMRGLLRSATENRMELAEVV